MDNFKWGPDEDSVPDFVFSSYCRCLGYQAAWCKVGTSFKTKQQITKKKVFKKRIIDDITREGGLLMMKHLKNHIGKDMKD